MSEQRLLITDFSAERDLGWFVVNDGVMGGKSVGGLRIEGGVLTLSGRTNTDGGGFSSIRTQPRLPSLAGCTGIIVRARGDGRRYILRLENADGVAYWGEFEPPADKESDCRVSLEALRPRFRGRWLSGPPLEPGKIVALGLMCYDGRDGEFCLQVSRVEAE
jgi:monofunctional biosynthetic peptidoglycan transglycosylase